MEEKQFAAHRDREGRQGHAPHLREGRGLADHHVRHRRQCPGCAPGPEERERKMTKLAETGPVADPEEGFTCTRALAAR